MKKYAAFWDWTLTQHEVFTAHLCGTVSEPHVLSGLSNTPLCAETWSVSPSVDVGFGASPCDYCS